MVFQEELDIKAVEAIKAVKAIKASIKEERIMHEISKSFKASTASKTSKAFIAQLKN